MARPEGQDRSRPLAMSAFASVPKEHRFRTTDAIRGEAVGKLPYIAQEYLQRAFDYFANHTDPYLRQLGSLGQDFFDPEVSYPGCGLELKVARSVPEGVASLRFPREILESMQNDKMKIVGLQDPKRIVCVVTYDFFTAANDDNQRIDLLGEFAFNLSHMESVLNDSIFTTPDTMTRALLTEAHFYNQVRHEEGVMLSQEARELLAEFPQGIYSPDIPREGRPPYYWTLN